MLILSAIVSEDIIFDSINEIVSRNLHNTACYLSFQCFIKGRCYAEAIYRVGRTVIMYYKVVNALRVISS